MKLSLSDVELKNDFNVFSIFQFIYRIVHTFGLDNLTLQIEKDDDKICFDIDGSHSTNAVGTGK